MRFLGSLSASVASLVASVSRMGGATPAWRGFTLACLIVFATGCEKKNDASRPATIAASPTGVPTTAPTAPPVVPPGATTAAPSAAGTKAGGSGGTIAGKITLDGARKANVTPTDVVYLVARRVPDSPGTRGALVAVKRYSASSFPIDFTLGAGDMMFKNGEFEGDLALAARVDKDGDPMTRRKGDVFGTLDRVRVGSTAVEIKLDQLQKEDESLAGSPPPPGGMPAGHP